MNFGLAGKVALVTGAGSGIGREAALQLAKQGARLGLLDLDYDEVEQMQGQIEALGGEALALPADVARAEQVKAAVQKLADRWGRLDIVFANAGINGVWSPVEELAPEEWARTIETNLSGTFLTVKYSVPYLKKQGGSIIVTASINGTRKFSSTGASAYSSSKAGQVAFTKMIALELAQHNIRANVICPGAIDTSIEESTYKRDLESIKEPAEYPEGNIPLTDGQPGSPQQVAQLVLFLASDLSSLITGTEIWIDGGESLLQG